MPEYLALVGAVNDQVLLVIAGDEQIACGRQDARTKRGLSVAEVAEQVGVSQASIYFWENDRVRPRDANLSALCKVLKLPIRATREMAAE